MSIVGIYLTDVSLGILLCFGLVAYINKPLQALLIELCGTAERARFWLAFSSATLILVPLILVLDYEPKMDTKAIFQMAAQLKDALVGFVVTLVGIAVVLASFIRRIDTGPPRNPAG